MLNIKNILCPTDFSNCSSQALEHALFLEKCCHATLHLFHAIVLHQRDPHNPAFHFPDLKELQEKLKKRARDRMDTDLLASSESQEQVDIQLEEALAKELEGLRDSIS